MCAHRDGNVLFDLWGCYLSILWSSYSFRFLERLVIISSLIPVPKVPHQFLCETAHSVSSSTDVDALKFRLVQYAIFYGGQSQQDSSECLMVLTVVINKGLVPCCDSNYNDSTWVSLSELNPPSFEPSNVLYITPTYTSSKQQLIMQGMQQKLEKCCFRCKENT